MSTLEATVGVVELLSEENLEKVQYVARQLLMNQDDAMLREDVLTKQQFLDELELSREQAGTGKCRDAKDAVNDISPANKCQ